jgi:hypothetical protein
LILLTYCCGLPSLSSLSLSVNRVGTLTSSASAIASSVLRVTFRSPRSTDPT